MRDRIRSFPLFSVFSSVLRCFPVTIQACPLITLAKRCSKGVFSTEKHLLATSRSKVRVGRPDLDAPNRAFLEKSSSESIGENGAFRSQFLIEKVV